MLNSHLIDQMDVSQSYQPTFEDATPDPSEYVPQITENNLDDCLRSERWKYRKSALSYLKDGFSAQTHSQNQVEIFSSRLPEILNDKNVTVLDEGLAVLIVFLRNANPSKSIFQFLVPFFLSNQLNKKLEKKVVEILISCYQINPDITYNSFSKRLEMDTPLAIILNVLFLFHQIVSTTELLHSTFIKGFLLKLKALTNHPNQKVRRFAIENIKELAKYILDDYSILQKSFLEGLKESNLRELQSFFEQPKHPNASFYLHDPQTSSQMSHQQIHGGSFNFPNHNQGFTSLHGMPEDAFSHPKNFNSQTNNDKNSFHNRYQTQEQDNYNSLNNEGITSPQYNTSNLKEAGPASKPRIFQKTSPNSVSNELQLPEKFFEIPHLKTVEEKRDILSSLNIQLQNLPSFTNVIPDQVFSILSNELEEANVLLYSVVLEVLSNLFQKSSVKQNVSLGQVKIILSLSANKYNIKVPLNEIIFSIFTSTLSKKYLPPEVHLRFILDETVNGKTKNNKLACLEWVSTQLIPFVARGIFNDFGKSIKGKSEYKKYLDKYTADIGKPIEGLSEETIMFVYYKINLNLEKEKQIKSQKLIKDVLKVLKSQIVSYRSNPAQFNSVKEDKEDSKLKHKLTNLIDQLEKSSDVEVVVSSELFLKGFAEAVQQCNAMEISIDKVIEKEILNCLIRINKLSKRLNGISLQSELLMLCLLSNTDFLGQQLTTIFDQLMRTFGLSQIIDVLFKYYAKSKANFNIILKYLSAVVKQVFNDKNTKNSEDLEDSLRKIQVSYIPASNELKGLRDYITKLLSQMHPENKGDSHNEEFFQSYQQKLDEERQKLQRNLENLPKINRPGHNGNSESLERNNNAVKHRIHEGANKSKVFEPLPPIPYYKSTKELSPSNHQLSSNQNLPLQELAFKEQSEKFEDCKLRFMLLIENVKNYEMLKTFVSRLSNSFKLLDKIMGRIAFKEISTHLEVILTFLISAGINYEQTFREFSVLILSILQEPEREKFFVLVLTYLGKADPFYEQSITVFFQYTKNPFRCFKFAFGIVSKNFDENIKLTFALNLVPVFLEKLGKTQWDIHNPAFISLIEPIFFIIFIHENSSDSHANIQQKKYIKQLSSANEKIETALQSCAQKNSLEDIEKVVLKETGNNMESLKALRTAIGYQQSSTLNKEFDNANKIIGNGSSDYNVLNQDNIASLSNFQSNYLSQSNQNQTNDLAKFYSRDIKEESLNKERAEPLNFQVNDSERMARESGNFLPSFKKDPTDEINMVHKADSGKSSQFEIKNNIPNTDNPIHNYTPNEKNSNIKINIKTNISELSKDEKASAQKVKTPARKTSFEAEEKSKTRNNHDRASSYKSMRDHHKKRMLSLENRVPQDIAQPKKSSHILDVIPTGVKQFEDLSNNYLKRNEVVPAKVSQMPALPNNIFREPFNQFKSNKDEETKQKSHKDMNDISNIGPWAKIKNSSSEQEFDMDSFNYNNITDARTNPQSPSNNRKINPKIPEVKDRINHVEQNKTTHIQPNENNKSEFSSDFEAYPSMNLQPDVDQSSLMHKKANENVQGPNLHFPNKKLNNMIVSTKSYFPMPQEVEVSTKPEFTEINKPVSKIPEGDKKTFKTISTQTEIPQTEQNMQMAKMEEKIINLKDKNTQIIEQLYQLNARNDDIKAENEHLKALLLANSQNAQVHLPNNSNLILKFQIDDTFCETLMFGSLIHKQSYLDQLAQYEDMDVQAREKFVFDLKFYVMDQECIQYTEEGQYAGFLNFISKLTVFQTMMNTSASDNTLRLLHKILDSLLKAKSAFSILKILLTIFFEEIQTFDQEGFSEFEILHIKLLLKCTVKIVELAKSQKDQNFRAFEVLCKLSQLFVKHPPELLDSSMAGFETYEEIFKLIKMITDEALLIDISGSKLFIKTFRNSKMHQSFINYVKSQIAAIEDSRII